MALVPTENEESAGWVNYRTGIKQLFFRLDCDNKQASVYIEITHPDSGIRELMFEQFLAYKAILESELQEEWEWDPIYYDAQGKETARIGISLDKKVSVFKEEDWPTIISFFKPRIMALDSFWSTAKYGFDIFK